MTIPTLLSLFLACQTAPPPSVAAEPAPVQELAKLDRRRPLPLQAHMAAHQKEQMRDHLLATQQITAALAVQDWSAAEQAALRLGTSPEMARTCDRMGAAAPGFTEQGKAFHLRADAIAEAARSHDARATLSALADTLTACTTCHEQWRQEVVGATEWEARAQ